MGLAILVLGLTVFIASHVFVTFRDTRAALIARFGFSYRVVFSIVSLVGVALIAWGYADYRAHEWMAVWSPPGFMHHVTVGLMLIASILLVATFIPSHIRDKTKQPTLAAIKTWAFAHLLVNGDVGSMLMFGSFLAWGIYARIAAKRRGAVPSHKAPAGWGNDLIAVIGGIVLFLALGYLFHPYVIGVEVLGN
jgi:uncharacterized membrane protein